MKANEPDRTTSSAPNGRTRLGSSARFRWHRGAYRAGRVLTQFRFLPALYARCRGVLSKHPLPPGDLLRLDELEQADRRTVLNQAENVGPIFKGVFGRRLVTCIVGLPHCRRFLKEHHASLTPMTVKLESLFPKGFLRRMKGDEHRHYRQALGRAIDPEAPARLAPMLSDIARDELRKCATSEPPSPEAYLRTLSDISTGMLIPAFFGARYQTEPFQQLTSCFHRLGPDGFEWFIGRKQKERFAALRDVLLDQASAMSASRDHWMRDGILGRMEQDGALDETSLGNLIYMVEMGRFDMASLFRWISKYVASSQDLQRRLQAVEDAGDESLHEAFVFETLRMDQIERLMRVVDRDIVFDGYLIPRFSAVRLCLWESHKAPRAFPDPFVFNPDRFLGHTYTRNEYAPFGLHHHSCPFGDFSMKMSILFLRVLTDNYTVEAVNDGPAFRGRYHWQPAESFTVRLQAR